jgi:cell fate regulator YaaT (PSP1 superfamily)
MIARREPLAPTLSAAVSDQYVVGFGKSGGLGCFTVVEAMELTRGDRVVVRTARGVEFGEVLGPATLRQARLIGALAAGDILRRCTHDDEVAHVRLRRQADAMFEACRARAAELALPLQILDVEVLLDGRHAIVQFVGGADVDAENLAAALPADDAIEFRLENLATPAPVDHEDHSHGGCGKPDCGRTEGGGCSTCSTGGGCSSCGAGQVDLRPYFAHLRDKMEAQHRTPLL